MQKKTRESESISQNEISIKKFSLTGTRLKPSTGIIVSRGSRTLFM